MQDQINKPVFVVGSPRSGTSILTWCLGQHPNMFPVPESNWMGDFAVSVAIGYQIGVARGERSILSAMEIRQNELFATVGQSINELILRHRKDLEKKRQATIKRLEPKGRWVDGTPEYSHHICGLRRLFPDALFVHICRDVRDVVRSMLNFHRVAGIQLVPNEEKAYKYWLRTVSACIKAENAYGPGVVYRVRYADLISNPESTMRSLLDFLQEPYTAKCLEPLGQRINSSNVPDDFVADDPATDPTLVEQATRLSAELDTKAQSNEPSPAAADALETEFQQRTQYVADLDKAYKEAQRRIRGSSEAKPRP
jgi:sulfotransferase family protein